MNMIINGRPRQFPLEILHHQAGEGEPEERHP